MNKFCIQWDGSDIIGYNRDRPKDIRTNCEYCGKQTNWIKTCNDCNKYFGICHNDTCVDKITQQTCIKCNRDNQINIICLK